MIVAVLDDLMFSSKIKTAAQQLGVRVVFARSLESALAEIRKAPPSLVVLDLNNPRTDPLGIVAAMKEDAALASIPTVGFASHVQTDVINAARQAGVGEVLARSAFTQQLGVRVVFARSLESALAEIRKAPPSLVVLDLNNPRTDPLGIVAAMKEDAALASIPTVGFASHVQTDVINAARQAGVGEVLARSAFTQQLGEILSRPR